MAKVSAVLKNERRRKKIAKYADKRRALKNIIRDPKSTAEQVEEAYRKLRALPRDSSATRFRNRCYITGRPRGFYRKFGLSRVALREYALRGELPGIVKSSW